MWNLFEVHVVLVPLLWTDFIDSSAVFIVDLEQVNAGCEMLSFFETTRNGGITLDEELRRIQGLF